MVYPSNSHLNADHSEWIREIPDPKRLFKHFAITSLIIVMSIIVAILYAMTSYEPYTSPPIHDHSSAGGGMEAGIRIQLVQGNVSTYHTNITHLNILIGLYPGTQAVDLDRVLLSVITQGTNHDVSEYLYLDWHDTSSLDPAPNTTHAEVYKIRDPNNSYRYNHTGPHFLDQDSIIGIVVDLSAASGIGSPLPPTSEVSLTFIQYEGGSSFTEDITTPPSYAKKEYITLI